MKKFSSFSSMFFNNFSEISQNSQDNNLSEQQILTNKILENINSIKNDKNQQTTNFSTDEQPEIVEDHSSIYDPEYNFMQNQNTKDQNKKQTERKQLSSHAQHLYSCMQNHDKALKNFKK